MPRNRSELLEENALLRARVQELERGDQLTMRARIGETVGTSIRTFLRWGFAFGMFFVLYRMVESLAGKVTLAQIIVNLIGSFTFTHAVAGAAGLAGVAYGIKEGHLRRQTAARLSNRIEELEKRIDPDRTTSELTKQGTTNPRDEER